jgi:hypothetical protein
MKTVLYCRVSTLDQTVEHQRTQAHQNGFKPDLVLADHGISGVSTRLRRTPGKGGDFSISCGRATLWWSAALIASDGNYEDVTDTVREFIRRGIRVDGDQSDGLRRHRHKPQYWGTHVSQLRMPFPQVSILSFFLVLMVVGAPLCDSAIYGAISCILTQHA